ncbi:MAG: phospho-sugar mutase [Akkermansiaceae bacterium]|jgi:phosphoglucomutase|nr:phospho-sugar mutase [Akkermansiaceae bacterium]MDP4647227.1 phospho-sugar mutase [Akkermansiaceae bacterium]MDP4719594.1 phospho-sugar mutase [Akkermansiaceae bacterium]MDP4780895.1 phospho-sugar mutase [Akkermansiaceae bacterium]MDP4846541.1 phospho-sugar mutase [Akkermansiaceae bacterium]
MNDLPEALAAAAESGQLLEAARQNIELLLAGAATDLPMNSVKELVEAGDFSELNDRFFKKLAFGTGGLRGRTIGRKVTNTEQGAGGPNDRPEFPCVGTATMNYYNVSRAVRGMVAYVQGFVEEGKTPTFVFAHDTRHFSKNFADFCAKICADLGCDAYVFEGPRSTPQLSFAVRQLRADAGVVITASHNPSHDCGFKAYFNDGGQIVEPHASAIIDEVNSITSERYEYADEPGEVKTLGEDFDAEYVELLKTLVLRPELLEKSPTKIVFTNLHGTGGHINVPMLRGLGFDVLTVPAQDIQDGRFPTVDSPNPENGPALKMAIDLANTSGAEIVIGTDPDADRMGVAVRNKEGEMVLLTGNQIGSLMAWYRLKTCFDLGWLTNANRTRGVLVKTFVTTELQTAIANAFGVSVVDTLTGFKYIAAKLKKYEMAIPADKKGDYRSLTQEQTRALRLEFSRFFVFGGEESYGYLGSDAVRDKDANGATLMFAEVAAYAKSEGKTLVELLDEIYSEYGYYLEIGKSLTMEGADGAAKIQALAGDYAKNPPEEVDGSEVIRFRDFSAQDIYDQEGDLLPKEKMLFFDLEDGRSFAVRPSGTEPKIKYYLFGKSEVKGDLPAAKEKVKDGLAGLWKWIENDAKGRG